MWKTFPGCSCLKQILIVSGYDNIHSLMCINEEKFNELEDQVLIDRQKVDCDHLTIYEAQPKFKLLLGHRSLILKWCADLTRTDNSSNESIQTNHPAFSPIMNRIMLSAVKNFNKTSNARRFPELLMQFLIYLYIMAGRACYEIIFANLPIPKASSISTFNCLDS